QVLVGRRCQIERTDICLQDSECPSKNACISGECVNPCEASKPCGVNADCKVLDTVPVRTMICECKEGYQGNAAVQCDKKSTCLIEKGFVRDINGRCVCPPGKALDIYNFCSDCIIENGFAVNGTNHCICDLERGMIIDVYGKCRCPTEHGYKLTPSGECVPFVIPECTSDAECSNKLYCNLETQHCEDPCLKKTCGINAFCDVVSHEAVCQCITGYNGNPYEFCNHTNFRTDFPRPDMVVSCLADGVSVQIHITEPRFNGVLYVKGHSKEEECRKVVNLSGDTTSRTELFKVQFGDCGLIHDNGIANFILKNVTLGFNVSMLTTAGTIANTGPPPVCQMRIVTQTGQEINSAEIGDNLMLQVDIEPATIYGGFARSCIAKTMEDNVENEYVVTDENG
uniref:ZP domain-containing protein n=1 Tax=Megaselia scalaris TaxID=36166 RepID=T1GGH8_MEGSC